MPSIPDQDPHIGGIVFLRTAWGCFPMTRAERYRLARLQGLPEAAARELAYGAGAAAPPPHPGPVPPSTYSAEELHRAFHPDGTARTDARGVSILPRRAETQR